MIFIIDSSFFLNFWLKVNFDLIKIKIFNFWFVDYNLYYINYKYEVKWL